jgi:hypothetical protein
MPRELPHEGTINCIDTDPIGYSEERGLESVSLTIGGERPLNPFNKLLDAARAELKAAGEQTDLEILEAIPNDDPKALRSALSKWVQDIVRRQRLSGKPFLLSRLTKAARFVAEQKMLMINLRYSAHGLTDDEPQQGGWNMCASLPTFGINGEGRSSETMRVPTKERRPPKTAPKAQVRRARRKKGAGR